jgi:hypothetical protein
MSDGLSYGEMEYRMPATPGTTASDAGTVDIGGDITVNRLGFGAMRISAATSSTRLIRTALT